MRSKSTETDSPSGGVTSTVMESEAKALAGNSKSMAAPPPRTARAIAPAAVERAALRIGGRKDLVTVRHLDAKVPPEIIVARDERGRRAGSCDRWIRDQGTIGIGQIDFDGDPDELLVAAVIEQGLLRAVVADVVAGELSELREGSKKSNGRDVRAGLGRREKFDVLGQEGCIVSLAEEIGFADRLVGKRRVKGIGGQRHAKNHKQACDRTNEVTHEDFSKGSIALIHGLATAE